MGYAPEPLHDPWQGTRVRGASRAPPAARDDGLADRPLKATLKSHWRPNVEEATALGILTYPALRFVRSVRLPSDIFATPFDSL